MDDKTLASWRQEYTSTGLTEDQLADEPFTQFRLWLQQAYEAGIWEPNAMVVATADARGAPSSRLVLLKGFAPSGFVFYTNYLSRKGSELDAQPRCSLLFPWHVLERQVRIEGSATRVDPGVSDDYFASRPRGAQVGAWVSPQSEVVASRAVLDEGYVEMSARWRDSDPVPRPGHWGGYRVAAESVEFWQGRPGRMHDRLRFRRTREDAWVVERLAP